MGLALQRDMGALVLQAGMYSALSDSLDGALARIQVPRSRTCRCFTPDAFWYSLPRIEGSRAAMQGTTAQRKRKRPYTSEAC